MNKNLKNLREILNNNEAIHWEEAPRDVYSHPEYITGFPFFLEEILNRLLDGISHTNEHNWDEGRYLIIKHKEDIDRNFIELMSKINLNEALFKGIKDIENFRNFM
jgi:hypothetical protein